MSADTGSTPLPVSLLLCQTNPTTAQCLAPPGPTVTTAIGAQATPTFAVFVIGAGAMPFDPAANRVFVRFQDAAPETCGGGKCGGDAGGHQRGGEDAVTPKVHWLHADCPHPASPSTVSFDPFAVQ